MKLTIVSRCWLELNFILQRTKASLHKGGTEVPEFRPQDCTSPNPEDTQAVAGRGGDPVHGPINQCQLGAAPRSSTIRRPTPRTDQIRAIEGSSPPTIAPPKMAHDEAIEVPRRKASSPRSIPTERILADMQ